MPDGKKFDPRPTSGTADAIGNTYLATSTGFVLKKNINKEDLTTGGNCGINIVLLRYDEVLLTYAEAKIELNQIDATGYDAINQIRQRTDVKLPALATGLSQAQLRDAVRKERLLELAFEGLRLFDIRRWKTAEKAMVRDVYGMTYADGADLKTVDVGFAGRFLGWMTDAWDMAPSPLNLLDPVSPTKRELLHRLRQANPDLSVWWLPRFVLVPLSWLATLEQKVLRPGKPAIDVAKVFSVLPYDTSGIAKLAPHVDSALEKP